LPLLITHEMEPEPGPMKTLNGHAISILLPFALAALSGCSGNPTWKPLSATADRFLGALIGGDMAAATADLTAAARSRYSPQDLQRFVSAAGIGQSGNVSWIDGSVSGDRATLQGEYRSSGSTAVAPLRLSLSNEQGVWRIQGIQRGMRPQTSGEHDYFVPFDEEANQLAMDTTLQFAEAIREKDLGIFWADSSERFRQRVAKDTFSKAFGGFVAQQTNLLAVAKLAPEFAEPPSISKDGVLRLAGQYPTKPSRVSFDYEYVREGDRWKLAGIRLDVAPGGVQ
jgi:hypothetical protein